MQQLELLKPAEMGESPAYLQEQLITYIGNKRSLLPFIGEAVRKVQRSLGAEKLRILDLFSGTGIVARYLKQFSDALFVNDLETYSRVTSECYLSNASSVDRSRLVESLEWLEREIERNWTEGFICDLYAPKNESDITATDRAFYTRHNAA